MYENTLPQSALRALWLDVYFYAGSPEWLEEAYIGAPISSEFLLAFSRFQMHQRTGLRKTMSSNGMCTYHEHEYGRQDHSVERFGS